MIYLLAFLAGIVAAVVGWFVTGAVAVVVAGWYGMSDFEGGRGMFAFLGVGPIGGLICMLAAIRIVLRVGQGSLVQVVVVGMRLAERLGCGGERNDRAGRASDQHDSQCRQVHRHGLHSRRSLARPYTAAATADDSK